MLNAKKNLKDVFCAVCTEKSEEQDLAAFEEALLQSGALQRLADGACRGGGAERLNRLVLTLLYNDHAVSPRFRTEVEEALSDRRTRKEIKVEEKSRSAEHELHEMRSIDDETPEGCPRLRMHMRPELALFV